ncbi:MAG: hypothetical protein JNJ57_12590, partial [Saprospiraceae bacterium]|nr:hypothetical protein [Saprospiraceae bacterium]
MKQNDDTHVAEFWLHLPPELAVNQPVSEVLKYLESKYGRDFYDVFENGYYASPVLAEKCCNWLKRANTVGINVRTIGNFWSVIPYALTLPKAQNAIHLLQIFEPGVVSSLYVPTSWNINPEFFSSKL